MLRLLLVRHGQSTWNAAGRLQGATPDVPLTPRGHRDARAVARRLARVPVAAVWSSDLLRSRQTAEPIAAYHGLAVRTSELLREQGHGEWEGGPFEQYEPMILAAEPDWAPPGGESADQVRARVARFLRELAGVPGDVPAGDVVVVSHGEAIRAMLAVVEGVPARAMTRDLPRGCAVVEATLRPGAAAR